MTPLAFGLVEAMVLLHRAMEFAVDLQYKDYIGRKPEYLLSELWASAVGDYATLSSI